MVLTDRKISLVPYLQERNGFWVKLDEYAFKDVRLKGKPQSANDIPSFDPLARMVKAELVTRAESKVQDLVLLISRDRYLSPATGVTTVTNSLVDRIWHDSHKFFNSLPLFQHPLWFYKSPDSNQEAFRFKSLFYCKKAGTYFHPPCPVCGTALELTEDDYILGQHGLPAYSSSPDRYLYCPGCLEKGPVVFYCLEKGPAFSTKVQLMEADSLVMDWGNLVENMTIASSLPCIECPERKACFSPERIALENIRILAFYPFYMIMFKAPDMPAHQFLELVSGMRNPASSDPTGEFFLEPADPRFFMEVLFLKLSFLCQVFRDIFFAQGLHINDASLLLDKLWVKLPQLPGLLPRLWSFIPVFMGLSRDIRESVKPTPFSSHIMLDFAVLWFHVLCVNKEQDTFTVNRAVERFISQAEQGTRPSWSQSEGIVKEIMNPEAIFHEPASFKATSEYLRLWRQVMDFGAELIGAAYKPLAGSDLEHLIQEAEALTRTARESLFNGVDKPAATMEQTHSPDKEIAGILDGLLAKWEAEQASMSRPTVPTQEPKPMPAQHSPADSGLDTAPASDISLDETLPLDVQEDEELPETIMLSGRSNEDREVSIEKAKPALGKAPSSSVKDFGQIQDDDFLEETVILGAPEDNKR